MNKSELVEVAAQEAGITKAAADKALSAIIGAVVKTVSKGNQSRWLVSAPSSRPSALRAPARIPRPAPR